MTDEFRPFDAALGDYTPEAVAACEKALRTLLAKIGPWGSRMVLVGGLVPRYLCRTVPDGTEPHVGTTDLDLVVGATLTADDEETYRTLQQNLVQAQFHPCRDENGLEQSYRWQRDDVDGVPVIVEFFCPAGEGVPGRLLRRPVDDAGGKLSAFRLPGAELAGRDHIVVPLPGEVLDQGGRRVDIRLFAANVLPFVVLKALAIAQRDKDKDAYDLVWTLTAFDEGPAGAAAAAAQSPILGDPLVAEAIGLLREHFATIESIGPARYARFFLGVTEAVEERDRLRRDAHGTARAFLEAWTNAGGPG